MLEEPLKSVAAEEGRREIESRLTRLSDQKLAISMCARAKETGQALVCAVWFGVQL